MAQKIQKITKHFCNINKIIKGTVSPASDYITMRHTVGCPTNLVVHQSNSLQNRNLEILSEHRLKKAKSAHYFCFKAKFRLDSFYLFAYSSLHLFSLLCSQPLPQPATVLHNILIQKQNFVQDTLFCPTSPSH